MKKILLLFVLTSILKITYCQVETKIFLNEDLYDQFEHLKKHRKSKKVKKFPAFDVQKMLEEDKLNEGLTVPFRFGKRFDVNLSLSDGEWNDLEGDQGRLWSMEFQSDGAYSINFVFDKFYLSDNSKLLKFRTCF